MTEPTQPTQISANLRKAIMAASACVLFSSVPGAKATLPAERPTPNAATVAPSAATVTPSAATVTPSAATVAQRIAQVRATADAQRSATLPNTGTPTANKLGWFGNWPNVFGNFPNWGKWGKWHNHFHNF